jgi:pimeloyl-ACP methyl ester carboxylesterase
VTSYAIAQDGARIAFDTTGSGRPVLLIHGFTSSRLREWHETGWVDALVEAGRRVIAFDVRGHGDSDRPHDPCAYGDHLVEDIGAVLAATNVRRTDIVAYSMGSHLAIGFLLAHSKQVDRVIIGGVGDAYFTRDAAWCAMTADAIETEDAGRITNPIALAHRVLAGQNGNDRLALAAFMRSPRLSHTARELMRVRNPVLVVCGEHDEVSGCAEGLAASFENGRALTLPGKNHTTALIDPIMKAAVLNYLSTP